MRRRLPSRRLLRGTISALAFLLLCLTAWALTVLPDFEPQVLARYPESRWMTDRAGRPLRILLGEDDLRCEPVPLDRSGDWAAKALVAIEDQRFFRHRGVDPLAIVRAIGQNLAARRVKSGASTISTQVIRLAEPRPRTWSTKLIEAAKAVGMERRLGKSEILEQYLNRAPFGGNLAGIQAASRRYFGRDAADLTLAEAALLMGLPQGPSFLRPDRHPDRARERRNLVLWRMEQQGFVERNARLAARNEPVRLAMEAAPFEAPHFVDLVVARGLSSPAPDGFGGQAVRTTLDLDLQRMVEEELARHVASLNGQGVRGGAVVLIEVAPGAVRALVGSPDYRDASGGQVNCAYRLRSPGSTLKPFAYAMALERGRITPSSVLVDEAVAFAGYEPRNFDDTFHGAVSARYALSHSLNVPALHVTQGVGLVPFVTCLRRLGLSGIGKPASHYGLSLVLGTGEVRLLNLANAYAALARGGAYRPARLLEDQPVEPGCPIITPGAAYLVADMLSAGDVADGWVGHRADGALPRAALKTGTSNGLRDAWAFAYNPEFVVGVWLGNPDGSSSPALVGIEVAAPLAYRVLRRLYPDGAGPWFARPAAVGERAVCALSGERPGPECTATRTDLFLRGVSRNTRCSICPPKGDAVQTVSADVPVRGSAPCRQLRITSPGDGTVYRRLSSIAGGEQSLVLKAEGSGEVFWFVDDRPLARRPAGVSLSWPLAAGTHRIVCSDAAGRSDAVEITVEPAPSG